MATDPNPMTNRSNVGKRALRGGAALVIFALLLGGLFQLVYFEEGRPNFYQPARAPLIDTAMILSEISAEEEELGQKFQTLHSRLDNAVALLSQAERLDPEDKRQIETVQGRLRALEDTEGMVSTDPKTLQQACQGLEEQVNTLVRKLEQQSPT